MDKKAFWGSTAGRIVALLIVTAFVFGTVALVTYRERGRELLLELSEVGVQSSKTDDLGALNVEFKMDKAGYCFSSYKLERKDGDIVIKLYASLTPSEYRVNERGYYTIVIKPQPEDKRLIQEGADGETKTWLNIHQ